MRNIPHVKTTFPAFPFSGKGSILCTLLVLLVSFILSACSRSTNITVASKGDPPIAVLAIVDGTPIEYDEYTYQFNRSAIMGTTENGDLLFEHRDFLERYVAYKLKVLEARAAGYEELPDLKSELKQYRNQLAFPSLIKSEVTNPLIKQFFDRRQEMIASSHILIRVASGASPADTLAAYNQLSVIMDSVETGYDFGDLAFRHSQDPSASGIPGDPGYRGYLGFLGAGSVVYEFENAMYQTKSGSVSDIFRTQFGFHIVFAHERKPFPQDLRIAHIMIRPDNATPADSILARSVLSDLRERLAEGEDFATLANTYSTDTFTARNGGELQRTSFDSGLPISMRDAAFDLDVDDVSEIVESQFGFHLIKLLERYPEKTFEESRDDIRARISKLPRAKRAEEEWKKRIWNESAARIDSVVLTLWAQQNAISGGIENDSLAESVMLQPIAWVADSTYSLTTFIDHLDNQSSMVDRNSNQQVLSAAHRFVTDRVMDLEITKLQANDDDFAHTIREFTNGLLLFRLMEDSVWTAAMSDSLGLLDYYNDHLDSLRFGDRTRVISFTEKSDSVLNVLVAEIRSTGYAESVINAFASDTLDSVRIDTTYLESLTNSVFDRVLDIAPGEITDPVSYNNGFIALYHDGVDPARLRTFDEARALVVNGYQEVLEDKLMKRLFVKYQGRIYPENLEILLGRNASSEADSTL